MIYEALYFRHPPSIRLLDFDSDSFNFDTELEGSVTFSPSHLLSSTKIKIKLYACWQPFASCDRNHAGQSSDFLIAVTYALSSALKKNQGKTIQLRRVIRDGILESLRLSPAVKSLQNSRYMMIRKNYGNLDQRQQPSLRNDFRRHRQEFLKFSSGINITRLPFRSRKMNQKQRRYRTKSSISKLLATE